MRTGRLLAVILLVALCTVQSASAQTAGTTGSLDGKIEHWRPEIGEHIGSTFPAVLTDLKTGQTADHDVTIDADGCFTINGLKPGAWSVMIVGARPRWTWRQQPDWRLQKNVLIHAGAASVSLDLSTVEVGSDLRGHVWPHDARLTLRRMRTASTPFMGPPPVDVPMSGHGGLVEVDVNHETGDFVIRNMPADPADLYLIATHPSHQRRDYRLSIVDGRFADVQVWLLPGAVLWLLRIPMIVGILILIIALAIFPERPLRLEPRRAAIVIGAGCLCTVVDCLVEPWHPFAILFTGLAAVAVIGGIWALRILFAIGLSVANGLKPKPPPRFAIAERARAADER